MGTDLPIYGVCLALQISHGGILLLYELVDGSDLGLQGLQILPALPQLILHCTQL